MLTETQILILFTCFALGAILRTLWGFLWKYLRDDSIEWDHRYTVSMVISIIITLIFAIVTFSSQQLPETWEAMHALSYISIGFTVNTLFNSIVEYETKRSEAQQR